MRGSLKESFFQIWEREVLIPIDFEENGARGPRQGNWRDLIWICVETDEPRAADWRKTGSAALEIRVLPEDYRWPRRSIYPSPPTFRALHVCLDSRAIKPFALDRLPRQTRG